jgi:hypothetical protein
MIHGLPTNIPKNYNGLTSSKVTNEKSHGKIHSDSGL